MRGSMPKHRSPASYQTLLRGSGAPGGTRHASPSPGQLDGGARLAFAPRRALTLSEDPRPRDDRRVPGCGDQVATWSVRKLTASPSTRELLQTASIPQQPCTGRLTHNPAPSASTARTVVHSSP
jgi:hypothetical protein